MQLCLSSDGKACWSSSITYSNQILDRISVDPRTKFTWETTKILRNVLEVCLANVYVRQMLTVALQMPAIHWQRVYFPPHRTFLRSDKILYTFSSVFAWARMLPATASLQLVVNIKDARQSFYILHVWKRWNLFSSQRLQPMQTDLFVADEVWTEDVSLLILYSAMLCNAMQCYAMLASHMSE